MEILLAEFILYVANQEISKKFYAKVLGMEPSLHVIGMTEFKLSDTCKLGIMPNNGIAKILGSKTPHPSEGTGIPRCELYLLVSQPETYLQRALDAGAKLISPFSARDWGHRVGYCQDIDGHILAFAIEAD